jgi:hypothetical protein
VLAGAPRGGYVEPQSFREQYWRPAQMAAGIDPIRRPYDLRHTYATFPLRAGVSIFDLSRFMGATPATRPPRGRPVGRKAAENRLAESTNDLNEQPPSERWTFGGRDSVSAGSSPALGSAARAAPTLDSAYPVGDHGCRDENDVGTGRLAQA